MVQVVSVNRAKVAYLKGFKEIAVFKKRSFQTRFNLRSNLIK